MNTDKPAIILDYDGTLHDSMAIYAPAFRKAMKSLAGMGLVKAEEYTDEMIRGFIGYTADEMWRTFQPGFTKEQRDMASGMVGNNMSELLDLRAAKLYPNVLEVLNELKASCELIFLSNCKNYYMKKHTEVFGLDAWFDLMYCSEQFGFIPKEEIFKQIRVPGKTYLVAGDRRADLMLAKENGLPFIGCLYGFGTKGELEGADVLIERVTELPEAVMQVLQKTK